MEKPAACGFATSCAVGRQNVGPCVPVNALRQYQAALVGQERTRGRLCSSSSQVHLQQWFPRDTELHVGRIGIRTYVLDAVLCREEAQDLWKNKPKLDALGVKLVAVVKEWDEAEIQVCVCADMREDGFRFRAAPGGHACTLLPMARGSASPGPSAACELDPVTPVRCTQPTTTSRFISCFFAGLHLKVLARRPVLRREEGGHRHICTPHNAAVVLTS